MPIDLNSTVAKLLAGAVVQSSDAFNTNSAKREKQIRYGTIQGSINIASYSTLERSYDCPRQFQLGKLRGAMKRNVVDEFQWESSVDLAFGKCFETGIQSTFLNKDWNHIWLDMMLAWDCPLDMTHPKNYKKSFIDCVAAVRKFQTIRHVIFENWDIAYFTNDEGESRPAIEVSMLIDMENGYFFIGHMDIGLRHRITHEFRVLELKTTAQARADQDAMYKNSPQSTGYSIMLESIAGDYGTIGSYEVYYLVYLAREGDFKLFEFPKSRSERAGWMNSLLMDISVIGMYRTANFFPKRGANCISRYGRVCEWFGSCDSQAEHLNGGQFHEATAEELTAIPFDFRLTLSKVFQIQTDLTGGI